MKWLHMAFIAILIVVPGGLVALALYWALHRLWRRHTAKKKSHSLKKK